MTTTPEQRKAMLPAQRAGELPGIMWESILNAMSHDVYVVRTEGKFEPGSQAETHLHELEHRIKVLRDYIMDGKE